MKMSDTDNTQQDFYSMSDEELLNYVPEQTQSNDTAQPDNTLDEEQETSNQNDNVNVDGEVNQTQDENTAVDDTNETANTNEDIAVSDLDYKAFYERVTGKFKANGKEISVNNPDDIISLMQQGANYSKRMSELKPKTNLIKTLEQHGLNDPDKLAFAIDLVNKKPEAIAKLMRDADIDAYSFDMEQADNYQPQNPIIESNAFEDTLVYLQDNSPNYNRLINSLNTWDNQSKQVIYNHPELLNILDNSISNGMFDKVMGVIEYEQMMGRMLNQPLLQSYQEIEARLNSQANTSTQQQIQSQPQSFTDTRPSTTTETNNTNNEQKRKASTPSNTHTSDTAQPDIFSMSDAELIAYMEQHTKR